MTMADNEVLEATKSQRRNRRRRQRKNQNAKGEADTGKGTHDSVKQPEPKADSAVQNANKTVAVKNKKKRKGKRRGRGLDIYFGRFRCKLCNRHWDSARVFTRGGTRQVLYKQRCKMCTGDDAWVFPFRLEIITCSQCHMKPCECLCEDCEKLKHKRFIIVKTKVRDADGNEETETEQKADPKFEYCDCEKQRKDKKLGDKIDQKKPHLSDLCEKCLKGRPCNRVQENSDSEDGDNEP